MKELKSRRTWTSLTIVILGLILFLYPGGTIYLLCRLIALALIISGTASVVQQLTGWKYPGAAAGIFAAWGSVLVVLGIVLWFNYKALASVIPVIIGIAIFANGIIGIVNSNSMRKMELPGWFGRMILSILMVVLGVIIFTNPFTSAHLLVMAIGVSLIFTGISSLIVF